MEREAFAMIIKVVVSDPDTWYSSCLHETFHVFQYDNVPVLYFTRNFFFYPEHIQVVKTSIEDPMLPQIAIIGQS